MLLSLRSLSKSRWRCRSSVVHDEKNRSAAAEEEVGKMREEEEGINYKACTSLTVWRKSLLFTCSGFNVIDCNGSLAYRVDNYIGRPGEVVLMDGHGKCVRTVRRRKNLSLVDEWLIYEGEASSNDSFERRLTRRHPSSSSTNQQKKTKEKKTSLPCEETLEHLTTKFQQQ